MIAIRPSATRGSSRSEGVLVRHSFSFGDYYDPAHMGFGPLRVINEIELAPGASVESERRANVEVLNWVVDGEVEHVSDREMRRLHAGDLHVLGAGRGIEHGLGNASKKPARVLQVWVQPSRVNSEPSSTQASFCDSREVHLIASSDRREGSLLVRSEVSVYALQLRRSECISRPVCLGRRLWLQVTDGALSVNGVRMTVGDAAVALHESAVELRGDGDASLILIDLDGR